MPKIKNINFTIILVNLYCIQFSITGYYMSYRFVVVVAAREVNDCKNNKNNRKRQEGNDCKNKPNNK